MLMTHYMAFLMENAPYNIIFFMAVPMIIADTIAITEIVYSIKKCSILIKLNTAVSLIGAFVMFLLGVFFTKEVFDPVTQQQGWQGWIDVTTAVCFMASVVSLVIMSFHQWHEILSRKQRPIDKGFKFSLFAIYMVTLHAAIIFGIVDLSLRMSA